jgi:glycosyltransferase involved in cell wall biosynthesis
MTTQDRISEPRDRISILFVIDFFHRTGGTERHLAQLVRSLPPEIFTCSVLVLDLGQNPLIDGMRKAGIAVIHLPVGREYTPQALVQACRMSALIRQNAFDVVQTFHQKSDTYGAIIARVSGVRHIVSSRRDIAHDRKPRHFFVNRCLRFLFEKVIVVSDAVANIVVCREGIDRGKIERIYNGVDSVTFCPPQEDEKNRERARLGLGPDDFVVGMVAGFRHEKNYDVFFQGAAKAMKSIPALKVLAVGGGPLIEDFRSQYGSGDMGKRVIFAGDVADVVPYLKTMDLGCLISQYEGFSNSVLECMAVGLPMIVSDVGGNAEAVIHQQNGLLIPPRDIEAFCSALIELHANPRKRLDMGRRSRQLVEEKFTLDQMCGRHAKLYQSLLIAR